MVTKAGYLTTRFGGYLHREVPEEDVELSHVAPIHRAANICAAIGSQSASPTN